jgi:hypothetical protein
MNIKITITVKAASCDQFGQRETDNLKQIITISEYIKCKRDIWDVSM